MTTPRARAVETVGSLAVLVVVLRAFAEFVHRIEAREGVVLHDPLLQLFRPVDATWVVFIALYGLLAITLGTLLRTRERLPAALQAYAVMVLLRMVAMYVTPLDPPPSMIPLEDPVVRMLGPSQLLTRDLFFSGHTATSVLAIFAVGNTRLRIVLAVLGVVVATGVLLQHVHYTIDVVAAVPFAWFAWAATLWVRRLAGRG